MENAVEVYDPVQEPSAPIVLSREEDDTATAFVDCAGSITATAEALSMSTREVREIIARPQVATRIKMLSSVITESHLIGLGSHLIELAHIRDLAKKQGQLKVALAAERSRGEVVGMYNTISNKNPQVAVQVNFVSKHDEAI